jgi:hypothetical protein
MPLTSTDADHRLRDAFRAFVLDQAEAWHRAHLGRLYEVWDGWNAAYFGGQLVPPYILLTPPESPSALGDCASISSFGGRCQIRVRPSLLMGTHPHVRAGDAHAEGRFRIVADVLLHESIHQYHMEITIQNEDSYHGHGPAFAARCNVIGQALGLPPVRSMKKRGKDKDLPSCAHWPLNVRPRDYYGGAYKPHDQAEPDDAGAAGDQDHDEADPRGAGDPLADLLDQILADLDAGQVARARATLAAIRARL